MSRLYRMPDGSTTTDADKYVATWETLGNAIQARFFPHHRIYGFDPDIGLMPNTRYGKVVTLSINTIRALLYSPAASDWRLRDKLLDLVGKVTPTPPRGHTSYVAYNTIFHLKEGDEIYKAGLDKEGRLIWHPAKILHVYYEVDGSVQGFRWRSGKWDGEVYPCNYSHSWSLDPRDFVIRLLSPGYPPFKVRKGPVQRPA